MQRFLLLWFALAVLVGCNKGGPPNDKKGGGKGDISFPVEVKPVEARSVEYTLVATGSVDAFEQVSITSRVTGVVETVKFKEGDRVEKGAVLVEIEPRRFQLAVAGAQAQMDRATAARADAEAFLARREKMSNEGVVSADELQNWRTKVATSRADEAAAKASLGLAQLNLRDAYVRAPIDGTVQTRTVQTGQFAQPGMVLATILRSDPMLLRFEVPEADAARVHTGMTARFSTPGVSSELTAKITHVAAGANSTSRMVAVVGEIASPPSELHPGAFAEVSIPVGTMTDAPVIPETAIRPSDKGFLSYVVEGGVAKVRVLTLGMRTKDGLVEVRSGLKPGESLVIRGSEALSDGAKVRVAGAPSASAAPASAAPSTAASAAPNPSSSSSGSAL
ncbi:MAG: efflux RND transporter periplasmic adaptor subunit [Polyangiaceae bacterium]|nr:efflux RND transporter periplasmic adaptor subunit [Polyangiaceae bacterium]